MKSHEHHFSAADQPLVMFRFTSCGASSHESVCQLVHEYGRVATSRTLPSLCSLATPQVGSKPVTHLRTLLTLTTVDYQGNPQVGGLVSRPVGLLAGECAVSHASGLVSR